MSLIFLGFITLAFLIFFWNFLRIKHLFSDKKIQLAMIIAYIFLITGMIGFMVDYFNFVKTPSLNLTIHSYLPDLIRALSDFLYPLGGVLFLFWFTPQLFSFLKDHRYTLPLLNAWKGNNASNPPYREISKRIEDLPAYKDMHEAQKEFISNIENQLNDRDGNEERSLLLNYGTRYELIAKCERIYNIIFGSQIQALKALYNNNGLDLTSFYEIHKMKTVDCKDIQCKDFNSWIQFLTENILIEKRNNYQYTLTNQGKYVIEYFEDNRLFLDKAF